MADPFVGFASNQFTIAIASPVIMVDGKKQGVVAASFYVNKLYRKIKAIHAEEGYAYVIDAAGKILLHPDKTMLNLSLPEQTAELKTMYDYMVKHKEGVYEDSHELMTFSELYNGWYIVVSVSKGDAYAFSNTMLKLFIVMETLMIALTVMILMKMTQKSLEEL
ncbi:Cache 3/Cache 2 fusion domain-containing protein [Sulfurospirillum diekertiae]